MTTFGDEKVSTDSISAETALLLAKSLVATVSENAVSSEKLRRQPDENIIAFVKSGLLRLLLPRRWGGYEVSFEVSADTIIEIARADASAGWCYSFLISQPWLLASFPEPAQKDVWESFPDATLVSAVFPAGRFTRTQGGFLLNGNWSWMSGVDHSQWALLMALPADMQGPPQLFLLPRKDIKVVDTWFVAGLKASGSKNAVVENVFIPEYRAVPFPAILAGRTPGAVVNPGPNYRLPMIAAFPVGLVAPILGATRGAFDVWQEMMRTKVTGLSREKTAMFTHNQILLAELASSLDAAELLFRRCLATISEGTPISLDRLVLLRRDYAAVAQSCVQIIEQIYVHSGGTANYESHPLQRYWRDIHAMAAHAAVNFDTAGESFGRFQLGLPNNPNDNVRFGDSSKKSSEI